MNKAYFAMCLHFHQPVGNFDNILERAYLNCYKPFLEALEKYPEIKMSFHFSGCLLDYFEDKHPEFLDKVKKMVDTGHVEIMGGGYYEPIFTSIPKKDMFGQIDLMSKYIKKRFGYVPKGIWIPERVWVPELSGDFHKIGIRYSILDDEHFIKSGINQDDLYGYFMALYRGKGIAIFPSNKRLRYNIPFKMPIETINYFKEIASRKENPLFTYGDDGEKFGEWPGTHDWVYKENWLGKFFDELMRNKGWLETIKFSNYLSKPPIRNVHIKEASYEEMMEWSNGSWMNFLKKYPEANHMHKKMWYVSGKVSKIETRNQRPKGVPSQGEGKPEYRKQIEEAKRELYKGQCNCGYWHGIFGGIYLYHLRKAIYEHLINADKIASEVLHKGKPDWLEIRKLDFYKDGKSSFIIENKNFSIYIDPVQGGAIRELDHKALSVNLINTLTRHKEAYHKKILEKLDKEVNDNKARTIHEDIKTIDPKLKGEFFYDRHTRSCLLDHFVSKEVTIEDFMHCKFKEMADLVGAAYTTKREKEKIIVERKGNIGEKGILITKIVTLYSKEIEISYILKNLSNFLIDTIFGVEFNITMPYLNSERYHYFSNGRVLGGLEKIGSAPNPELFSIKDNQKELDINFIFSKKPESAWYFPVKTISQSERAYELNYQSSCIFPRWHIKLDKGIEVKFNVRWVF